MIDQGGEPTFAGTVEKWLNGTLLGVIVAYRRNIRDSYHTLGIEGYIVSGFEPAPLYEHRAQVGMRASASTNRRMNIIIDVVGLGNIPYRPVISDC